MLKMPDKRIFVTFFLILLTISLFGEYSPDHYYIDLVKHYISLEEYDLALEIIDKKPHVDCPDSLLWFKGNIHKVQKEQDKALESFIEVIKLSTAKGLQEEAYHEILLYLDILSTEEEIELFVSMLEHVEGELYNQIILRLAHIYEQNNLYEEANDIYLNLLQHISEPDTLGLRIKVATNDILQRNYQSAVKMAREAQAAGDSTQIPQALFIEFMGHYSQDEYEPALRALVKLYLNYPAWSLKFEVYLSLSELLIIQKHYLAAWYIIDQYYPFADLLEKQLLNDNKQKILRAIQKPENQFDMFDLFDQDFRKLLE